MFRRGIVMVLVLLAPALLWLAGPAPAARASNCVTLQQVTGLATEADGTLLAGTADGTIYALHGSCWTTISTLPGRVGAYELLQVPGRPSSLIAGSNVNTDSMTSNWGLFRSDDGGGSWMSITDGLPLPFENPNGLVALRSGTLIMTYDPINSNGHQMLVVSRDGGATWRQLDLADTTESVVTLLGDGSVVTEAESSSTYDTFVLRSRNEGRTWRTLGTLPAGGAPEGTMGLYSVPWEVHGVVGYGDPFRQTDTVFHSADGGAHWSAVGQVTRFKTSTFTAIAAMPKTHTLILGDRHAIGMDEFAGIYRSTDEGKTVQFVTSLGKDDQVEALAVSHDDAAVYAATLHGVLRSTDDGKSWQDFSSGSVSQSSIQSSLLVAIPAVLVAVGGVGAVTAKRRQSRGRHLAA